MSTSTDATPGPARIMMWSTSRSLSTAFARSMSARGDTEIFWEPYFSCYFFGPDGADRISALPVHSRYRPIPCSIRTTHYEHDGQTTSMINDKYTYSYVKELLKAEYPDAKILFVKDMVEGIKNNFHVVEHDFRHSFIIRHPRKTFRSLYRIAEAQKGPQDPSIMISRHKDNYHILERFYHFVQSELGQQAPPLIDADDLVDQPEKLLPKYCQAVGIGYTPNMLEWESIDADQLKWHCTDVGIFAHSQVNHSLILSNAMKGQGFGKAPDPTKDMELPSAFEEMISHALPVYQRLYELRIRPYECDTGQNIVDRVSRSYTEII